MYVVCCFYLAYNLYLTLKEKLKILLKAIKTVITLDLKHKSLRVSRRAINFAFYILKNLKISTNNLR